MCHKTYNKLYTIVVVILSISLTPGVCAMYPNMFADQAQYPPQYQAGMLGVNAHALQLEQLEQLPPLQVLLSSGAIDNDDLARALTAIRMRAVPLDMQDNLGQTALHVAAQQGHFEVVEALLAAHVNTQLRDRYNRTALEYAQRNNYHAIAALLQLQTLQPIQQHTQNVQVHGQERARQNTGISFKELLLLGCTTGALALLVYKLVQENPETQNARY